MAYDKFNIINSSAIPLNMDNVDTDQIIPARYLKATERKGFGDNLFRDWRYDSNNEMIKDFPFNNKNYSGKILVAGKNFGCGSSREHAVWAIYDYGFRAVVSSFFADIFKNNCLNIGVLPVQISESFLSELFNEIEKDNDSLFEINLPNQSISIMSNGQSESFNISNYKKENMMNGFDDIDYLVDRKEDIITFANKISH
ncbi:MAG TPA: 3-isopropylmalate dehydratase small subunit [Flavobacteriaceae bacterium]|jgi:3-isopropylmalate/(R)-2-methylmalate dehydratase small subunit|nr:3-isopropylmalate dehydratase small subunit [Flavobacteriaceae bacterium]MDP7184026.1 3-isopropylmalate dehydratase small subunit [Flavobacteriaceae bacterium]HJO71030.1 3-isopropylmalate dehydratase small subunit [Flavobacteriaceae bacterium]|tara:strand:- start:16380 stop:16976 length:597 start_codon:yes stop_codon:yes gene_type:complete